MILFGLKNHPFGGAGCRNHPCGIAIMDDHLVIWDMDGYGSIDRHNEIIMQSQRDITLMVLIINLVHVLLWVLIM